MPDAPKGKALFPFPTFYGKSVQAYEPVVGEQFGPWTIVSVGTGPFIGQTWGGFSFPDGTVMQMSGQNFTLMGLTLMPTPPVSDGQ